MVIKMASPIFPTIDTWHELRAFPVWNRGWELEVVFSLSSSLALALKRKYEGLLPDYVFCSWAGMGYAGEIP